jgi:hypothetical protein
MIAEVGVDGGARKHRGRGGFASALLFGHLDEATNGG